MFCRILFSSVANTSKIFLLMLKINETTGKKIESTYGYNNNMLANNQ